MSLGGIGKNLASTILGRRPKADSKVEAKPAGQDSPPVPADNLELSGAETSNEAALHYGISGATVAALVVGTAVTAIVGAGAGAAGLGAIGVGIVAGGVAALAGGVANAVRGRKSAKQANPSMLKRMENAFHFGVSAAVTTTAAVGVAVSGALAGTGPGAVGGLLAAPVAGVVAGGVNAVRGWNLQA